MARRTGREAEREMEWRRRRAGRRNYRLDTGITGRAAVRRLGGSGLGSRRTAAAEVVSEGRRRGGRGQYRQLPGLGHGRGKGRQFRVRLDKAPRGEKAGRAGIVGAAIIVGVEPLMPSPVGGEDAAHQKQSAQKRGRPGEDGMASGFGWFCVQSVCM